MKIWIAGGVGLLLVGCGGGSGGGSLSGAASTPGEEPTTTTSAAQLASPTEQFLTYLGRSGKEVMRDVAVGPDGSVYVTGGTESSNFPTTPGAYDRSFNGVFDVVVCKFSPGGTLLASTFLGGSGYDRTYSVDVEDGTGNVYVAGRAGQGFPTTPGVIQPNFAGSNYPDPAYGTQDGFIAVLDGDLSTLIAATYFGGNDRAVCRDMELARRKNGKRRGQPVITMIKVEADFPHVKNAFQPYHGGGRDMVVAKMKRDLSDVVFCTHVGGSADDTGTGVTTDAVGNVYAAGFTYSDDFPVTGNAFQSSRAGLSDMYVVCLGRNGSLDYSTYFGGSSYDDSETHSVSVYRGHVTLAARTTSPDLPTTSNAFNTVFNGGAPTTNPGGDPFGDAFVAVFERDMQSLRFMSYIGGTKQDNNEGAAWDDSGRLYVSGHTLSNNWGATADAAQPNKAGSRDATLVVLNPMSPDASETLQYATYIGGNGDDWARSVAIDRGSVYVIGYTLSSSNLSTQNSSTYDPTYNGSKDGWFQSYTSPSTNQGSTP